MNLEDLELPPMPAHLLKDKKPTFKYGSSTYMILAYACIYDRALTIDDFQKLSNGRFRDKGDIKKALSVLVSNKSMAKLNDSYWRITPLGMRHVVELSKENKAGVPVTKKKYRSL